MAIVSGKNEGRNNFQIFTSALNEQLPRSGLAFGNLIFPMLQLSREEFRFLYFPTARSTLQSGPPSPAMEGR